MKLEYMWIINFGLICINLGMNIGILIYLSYKVRNKKMSNKTICPECGKDSNFPSLWCSDECELKDSKLFNAQKEKGKQ